MNNCYKRTLFTSMMACVKVSDSSRNNAATDESETRRAGSREQKKFDAARKNEPCGKSPMCHGDESCLPNNESSFALNESSHLRDEYSRAPSGESTPSHRTAGETCQSPFQWRRRLISAASLLHVNHALTSQQNENDRNYTTHARCPLPDTPRPTITQPRNVTSQLMTQALRNSTGAMDFATSVAFAMFPEDDASDDCSPLTVSEEASYGHFNWSPMSVSRRESLPEAVKCRGTLFEAGASSFMSKPRSTQRKIVGLESMKRNGSDKVNEKGSAKLRIDGALNNDEISDKYAATAGNDNDRRNKSTPTTAENEPSASTQKAIASTRDDPISRIEAKADDAVISNKERSVKELSEDRDNVTSGDNVNNNNFKEYAHWGLETDVEEDILGDNVCACRRMVSHVGVGRYRNLSFIACRKNLSGKRREPCSPNDDSTDGRERTGRASCSTSGDSDVEMECQTSQTEVHEPELTNRQAGNTVSVFGTSTLAVNGCPQNTSTVNAFSCNSQNTSTVNAFSCNSQNTSTVNAFSCNPQNTSTVNAFSCNPQNTSTVNTFSCNPNTNNSNGYLIDIKNSATIDNFCAHMNLKVTKSEKTESTAGETIIVHSSDDKNSGSLITSNKICSESVSVDVSSPLPFTDDVDAHNSIVIQTNTDDLCQIQNENNSHSRDEDSTNHTNDSNLAQLFATSAVGTCMRVGSIPVSTSNCVHRLLNEIHTNPICSDSNHLDVFHASSNASHSTCTAFIENARVIPGAQPLENKNCNNSSTESVVHPISSSTSDGDLVSDFEQLLCRSVRLSLSDTSCVKTVAASISSFIFTLTDRCLSTNCSKNNNNNNNNNANNCETTSDCEMNIGRERSRRGRRRRAGKARSSRDCRTNNRRRRTQNDGGRSRSRRRRSRSSSRSESRSRSSRRRRRRSNSSVDNSIYGGILRPPRSVSDNENNVQFNRNVMVREFDKDDAPIISTSAGMVLLRDHENDDDME